MKKLKIGDQYQEPVTFTQERVNTFAEVTGDKNPIHLDEAYAAKTPFGKPIVHGFLAGAVFSKVLELLGLVKVQSIYIRRCHSEHLFL